jgi:hypothetical protein
MSASKMGNTHSKNQPHAKQIEVTDVQNNTTINYDSISAAARALNIKPSRISMYFANNQQKPYKGRYVFHLI